MKKLLIIPFFALVILFTSFIFFTPRYLAKTDKIVGNWEIIETDEENMTEEEMNAGDGPALLAPAGTQEEDMEGPTVKIMFLVDGDAQSMLAAFKTEGGFACPSYCKLKTDGLFITGKGVGLCSPEETLIPFKFGYRYDAQKDQLVVTFRKHEYRYRRFAF
jgi:hypothetical protein